MSELNPILEFLSHYGYWIAIPIMIVEGPIITLVMGFLSSFGLFNIFIVIALCFLADLISDAFYYWTSYYGGEKVLSKLRIPHVQENGSLLKLKKRFEEHLAKILFTAKILPGVTNTTLVLAGVVRIRYWRVFKSSILGGLIWSTGLATLGFYFGRHARSISGIISSVGIIFFILLILFLFYIFWFGKFIARKYAIWRDRGEN